MVTQDSIRVRIDSEVKNKLLLICALENANLSDLLRDVILDYIKTYGDSHGIRDWKVQ